LIRQEETDSSIAAELYVPGYKRAVISGRAGAVRETETRTDSNQDIRANVTDELRKEYTDKHLESSNPYHRSKAYAVSSNPSGDDPSTMGLALSRMEEKFLTTNPRPALESGRATTESADIFLDDEELQKFRNKLVKEVLQAKNLFHPNPGEESEFPGTDPLTNSASFFKPNASNEHDSFPEGLFRLPTQGSPAYGRYDKTKRKPVRKKDLVNATNLALQEASNLYLTDLTESPLSPLPRVPFEKVRMAALLANSLDLRLDSNGNIYKARKESDDESAQPSDSYGVGNSPGNFLDGLIEVREFNQFFQYGAVGVVIKAAVYVIPMMITLGAVFILPLLWWIKAKDNLEGTTLKFVKEAVSALPPTLIRLTNELGLNGEELKLTETFGADIGQIGLRIAQGWRILFGFYDDDENIGLQIVASLIPDKITQSPQFHFTLARRLLQEIESAGSNPLLVISKIYEEPSSSLLLRMTAVAYKLGVRAEQKASAKAQNDSVNKNNRRSNRHQLFDSEYKRSNDGNSINNPLSLKYFDYAAITSNAPAYTGNEDYFTTGSLDKSKDGKMERFDPSKIEEIEKKIDADYVPFSIQDLRTNEIIALPAFIDSISDNFSVNYESTHGYGRTDPVYTYSKTERSVELSFNLVAFNPQDHDRMYEIVNQLTSMCYPQRSRGQRRVNAAGQQFFQPFSQIQTASPMVRVRLGNMIRSNRSQRGYAQLFGNLLGTKFFTDEQTAQAKEKRDDLRRKLKEQTEFLTTEKARFEEFKNPSIPLRFANEGYRVITKKTCRIVVPNKNGNDALLRLSPGFKLNVQMVADADYYLISYGSIRESDLIKNYINKAKIPTSFLENSRFKISKNDVVYDESYITVPQQEVNRLNSQLASIREPENPQDAQNFLNPTNNPIVRSFQTTSGRGLACFIKSLGLDYNNVPWNTHNEGRIGNRDQNLEASEKSIAPTRIKISMSLAPIHDMPLGLSYDGTIMAPSHPVGPWSLADIQIPNSPSQNSQS
jgi:hypothetical protein